MNINYWRNGFISILLISSMLLSFNSQVFASNDQAKYLVGEITAIKENEIEINNKIHPIAENALLVFNDQLGSRIIKYNEIPNNINALYKLNMENKIFELQISGQESNTNKNNITKLYEFKDAVFDFDISADEQLLAFFDWSKNLLNIMDLKNKKIIWQTSLEYPTYAWHPKDNVLAFSNSTEEGCKLAIINIENKKEKVNILVNQSSIEPGYINNISWSPQGKDIAFTILQGLPNAHGYISGLNLTDTKGNVSTLANLTDISSVTWSPTGRYLAYSQLKQTDMSTSTIGIYDFNTNKNITISDNKNQINPIFTSDEKNLVYTEISGISQSIKIYDFKNNKNKMITNEIRYIDDFCWFDKETLAYTFGDIPQIKLYNIFNGKEQVISYGFSLKVTNEGLYFLTNDYEKQTTGLYKYQK